MKIIYFTATGNCLAVAKQFDAEILSIPQMIKQKRYSFEDEEAIGIIYPTYNAGVPYIVKDYLSQCEIESPYVFVIATYGNIPGGTLREIEKVLVANNNYADYFETLLMVDNYLPVFEMGEQLSKVEEKEIEKNLSRIVTEVSNRTKKPPKSNVIWKVMAAAMGTTMRGAMKKSALSYVVNDDCIGCGICSKVCPVANIKQTAKDKPVFASNCERCYACVHNCPKKAIHLRNERSGERFRNSEVTVKEIIDANSQGEL